MDIVFSTWPEGKATFEPNKVRTDKNGQAETYITFGPGKEYVDEQIQVKVKVNMVWFIVDHTMGSHSHSHSQVGQMSDNGIYVDGKTCP